MTSCIYNMNLWKFSFLDVLHCKHLNVENILIAALLTVHLHGEQLTIIHPR